MSDSSQICPKCGYKRQPGDHECPRCGIIYDKFISSHSRKATTADHPRLVSGVEGVKKQWPLWMKVALPVLVVVITAAVWSVASRSGTDTERNTPRLDDKEVSFPYPLEGTWEGSLYETMPSSNEKSLAYEADFKALVTVGKGGTVKEIRWTDFHSPYSRTNVTWKEGNVEISGLDRRGSSHMGTPEIMRDPMEEFLKVQQQGAGMTVSFNDPQRLKLEFSIPDAFPRKADEAYQRPQMQTTPDSLTLTIPIHLFQENSLVVPLSRISISKKVIHPENSNETWVVLSKEQRANLKQDGSPTDNYYTHIIPNILLDAAGIRLWVTLEEIFIRNYPNEPLDPERLTPLENGGVMKLNMEPFERQIRVRFTTGGQVTLEVINHKLSSKGQAMIYQLKRTG